VHNLDSVTLNTSGLLEFSIILALNSSMMVKNFQSVGHFAKNFNQSGTLLKLSISWTFCEQNMVVGRLVNDHTHSRQICKRSRHTIAIDHLITKIETKDNVIYL
jgi:hypothetical protein